MNERPGIKVERFVNNERPFGTIISAISVPGSDEKPNEDSYSIRASGNNLRVCIFDGTTSLEPVPGLSQMTGAQFAANVLRGFSVRLPIKLAASEILEKGNQHLLKAAIELGCSVDQVTSLPAATGAVLTADLRSGVGDIADVGDSFYIAYYLDGRSEVLTLDRNRKFDFKIFGLIQSLAKDKGITNRDARFLDEVIEAMIKDRLAKINNPDISKGTGLINGDPNMVKYIHSEQINLEGLYAILGGTDGLMPVGRDLQSAEDREYLLEIIESRGLQGLVDAKIASEEQDLDWSKQVRFKHSDDATGVFLQFHNI